MTLPDLTVKDRIQLYLFDYNRYTEAFDVPVEVTQEAIANAVGIRVTHVPQYIRPLLSEGLVEERSAHILRQKRRRKAYFLTAKGRTQVAALRNTLLQESVPIKKREGDIVQVPLSRLYHEDRRGASLFTIVQELRTFGHALEVTEVTKAGLVDFTEEAPKVERFYGRVELLRQVSDALGRARLVVVTGMAGIGKTTLGAKVCESVRGKQSLFWRQIRPWDTAMDVAYRLGAFLKAMGRTELHAALVGKGMKEMARLEEPLAADLAGASALLVFDDAQNASHETMMLLSLLLRTLRRQQGTSALVLSRTVPAFYSRREVAVEGLILEFALPALDPASSESILAASDIAADVREPLIKASGGNPLFLKLLALGGTHEAPRRGWGTVEAYIAEEIEPALESVERGCLQLASFYDVSVPSRGLLHEREATAKTLVDLHKKGLLTATESDRYILHDSLRDYFQQGLSTERRTALVATVIPWLLREAETCATEGRPLDAIACLGNALSVDMDQDRRPATLERIGDLRRIVGDLPGAVDAYRTVMTTVESPAAKARALQKAALTMIHLGDLKGAEWAVQTGLSLLPPEPSIELAWLIVRRAAIAFRRQDYDAVAKDLEKLLGWMPLLQQDPALWGTVANERGLLHIDDHHRFDAGLAKADFESAILAFQSVGDQRSLAVAHNNLGLALIHFGHVDEAMSSIDAGLAIADATGNLPTRELCLFSKAWCVTNYLGDLDTAEKIYQETYRLAKQSRQRHKLLWHSKHFSTLYQLQGRLDEARESLAYFLENSADILSPESRIDYVAEMARLCAQCGDLDSAQKYLREAEAASAQSPTHLAGHLVSWAKAAVLASQGKAEDAAREFEIAARAAPPRDRGEFLVEYGRFLAEAGKRDDARLVLQQACEEFKEDPRKPLEKAAQETLQALES